mgnify:CR=1 FL=1
MAEMNVETARMEVKFEAEMKAYEDGVRKTMKGLGFNIFIFPEGQELGEVYAEGFASKTMPEEYVSTLANSKIVTVNHLLPSLTRKLKWPEKERTVILIGIRSEVPIAHRDPKKPLIDPVKKGHIVLGHELHKPLGLSEGNTTTFMGREFIVGKCHAERGTKDDITVWMHLDECQELLDEKGRINAIKALECNCATLDRLGEIRREIAGILPGTKVIETESKALARAEARNKAKKLAQVSIAAKKADAELHGKKSAPGQVANVNVCKLNRAGWHNLQWPLDRHVAQFFIDENRLAVEVHTEPIAAQLALKSVPVAPFQN